MSELKKKIWWALFLMGLGGVIISGLCFLSFPNHGAPDEEFCLFLSFPVLAVVISGWMLRRRYRLEPSRAPGHLHLYLSDLMIVVFSAALQYVVIFANWPDVGLFSTTIVLILSGYLIAGLLHAARRGILRAAPRWLFAVGFAGELYGGMTLGFVVLCGTDAGISVGVAWLAEYLRCVTQPWQVHDPVTRALYFGWVVLIAGFVLCQLALRLHKYETANAAERADLSTDRRHPIPQNPEP